jgi:hypothetical protein
VHVSAQCLHLLAVAASISIATQAARAHLVFIDFESTPGGVSLDPNQPVGLDYINWGAIFTGDLFTTRYRPDVAVSEFNIASLSLPLTPTVSPVTRLDFVYHGTTFPSIATFVAVTPVNSASPGTIFSMTAWDTEDGVIQTVSTLVPDTNTFDSDEDQELIIYQNNIAYVTFTATAPTGQVINVELDNLRYNHIIPAPAATALVALSLTALRRRR